jgi:ribosome recycling factor
LINFLRGSQEPPEKTGGRQKTKKSPTFGSLRRAMDELSNISEGTTETPPTEVGNANPELRKRRSTRIVQAVPLAVTGVDAIGRPFTEHTSTLIINCHGCRFQSKHYVLKNMWVKLEIPHPESGQAPRVVRGRVAWIQRPRTVRQLFQVALELETPGNVWGIAFPPEDWFAFLDVEPQNQNLEAPLESQPNEMEHEVAASNEAEPAAVIASDNLRTFPSPASTTDASLQLARQLARLVADAKQQIQAAAREAASQAVAAEHRTAFEQWEQKFAAARKEVANETSRLIQKIQQEAEKYAQSASAAAIEALRGELPRHLAPQLEQITQELTSQLSREGLVQRDQHVEQLRASGENLITLFKEAQEVATRLKTQADEVESRLLAEAERVGRAQAEATRLREETSTNLAMQAEETEAHIADRADAAARTMEEAARVREEALVRLKAQAAQTESQIVDVAARALEETGRLRDEALSANLLALRVAAEDVSQQVKSTLSAAQQEWESHLTREIELAQARWNGTIETTLPEAQNRAIGEVETRARELFSRLQDEAANHGTTLRDQAAEAMAELERRLLGLRESLQETEERLEFALARAGESTTTLEHFSTRLGVLHEQALVGFHEQLDDVLSLHRNELHRRSEAVFDDITMRIKMMFEEESQRAAGSFEERVSAIVNPHLQRTEESIHRMAGGRALLDAALSMQQDRIRKAADDAFAESLSRFRDNLGSAEQLLDDASRTVTGRNLAEMEEKLSDIKHQAIQDVFKSAEWYEKKAQTQIQNVTEKAVEQAGSQLREKAGEISSMFTSELDNSSRNFVGHTQSQMEDTVRDAFERARSLFSEASETTSAAFTDEIQRTGRQELEGFGEDLQKSVEQARAELDGARRELSERVTAEQEEFLRRFQTAMNKTLESGITDAHVKLEASFSPLLDSWRVLTDRHQSELRSLYAKISEQATEHHRARLENVSNQWMLATVTSLDRQSREVVANISASAEEKLRETCTQVFASIGETLQERLQQIARNLTIPTDPNTRSRTATSGS